MSKKKIIIGSIILLVVVVIVVLVIIKNGETKAIEVQTIKVEKQKIVETVTATGWIQPKTQVKISADVAAKIIRMDVKEGDIVKEDDFLVQLDSERFLASVESAEANLRPIKANAEVNKENMIKADKDYKRTKKLFDKQLESEVVLDQIYAIAQVERARYQSALEQVEQAKASLKQIEDALSKTTIYAPMAGIISELNKEVGEIALGSQFQEDVIMVISNLSGMEALVNVDENDIVSVSLDDSAKIEVDALPDKVYNGVVTEIANSATITGRGSASQKTEFEVKINIIDPGIELRPGMSASSDIITDIREHTLGVPIQSVAMKTLVQLEDQSSKSKGNDAITDSALHTYTVDKEGFAQIVFVVEKDHVIAKQVSTGIQSEKDIEVLKGLSIGDEVVTGSFRAISQQLKNHTVVTVNNEKTQ